MFGADEQPAQLEAEVPYSPQLPAFSWPDSVEVPLNEYALDNDHLAELQQCVDPLGGQRDGSGVDLLQEVITFLDSL